MFVRKAFIFIIAHINIRISNLVDLVRNKSNQKSTVSVLNETALLSFKLSRSNTKL